MAVTEKKDPPLKLVNLVKVPLRQWRMYMLEEPDLEIDAKPFVALTLMYHPETHEYVWRVLGRLIESGQVNSYKEFLDKCHQLFNSGTPCLGKNPRDAQFPLSCEFSENCSIMIPKSKSGTACSACIPMTANSNGELWREILDVIYDDGIKTLESPTTSNPKVWSCSMCSVEVPMVEIKHHLEKAHFLSRFVCFHCQDRFVDAKDLSCHTIKEHPEIQEVFCPICSTNVPLYSETECLANHFRLCCRSKQRVLMQDQMGRQVFKCQLCSSQFSTNDTLKTHFDGCHANLDGQAGQGEKDPLDTSSIPQTKLSSSSKTNPSKDNQDDVSNAVCHQCGKEMDVKFLHRHLMFHHRIGDFKCASCVSMFQSAEELSHHVSAVHPAQGYLFCPNCAKEISILNGQRNLVKHIDTCHKNIFFTNAQGNRVSFKGFSCSDCGRIFRSKTDLDLHESQECDLTERPSKIGPKSSKITKTSDADINPNFKLLTSADVDDFLEGSISLKLEPPDSIDDTSWIKEEPFPCKQTMEIGDLTDGSMLLFGPNPEVETSAVEFPESKKAKITPQSRSSSSCTVECHVCFRKLPADILPKHLMFRHQIGQFDCPKCPLKANNVSVDKISKHLIEHPDVFELNCPNCKQDVSLGSNRNGLQNHIATCHKLKFYWDEASQMHTRDIGLTCMDCDQMFDTPDHLLEHEAQDICDVGTDASKRRKNYIKYLLEMRKPKQDSKACDSCDEKFPSVRKLNSHKKLRHSFNPLLCNVCGKKFPNEATTKFHMNRFHPTSDKLICKECGYIGGNENSLRRHQRIHAPPSYICCSCGKEFTTEERLQYHMNRHHPTTDKFNCQDCGFIAGNGPMLKRHQRTHEAPTVMCPICGKRFVRKNYLKDHMRTHTGEKPFKCDSCDYRTAAKSNLCNHVKFVHKIQPQGIQNGSTQKKRMNPVSK